METNHIVYILKCADGTYYTGYTNNLDKRIDKHQSGKGAKYTRGRTPVKLMYTEQFITKQEAMRREYAIKQLNREEKEYIIKTGGCYEDSEKLSR